MPRKIAPEEYIVLGDEQEAHWEVKLTFHVLKEMCIIELWIIEERLK